MRTALLMLLFPLLLPARPAPATSPEETARKQLRYTRPHYTEFDYRIPMRDCVKLFTGVDVPKDSQQKYPIVIQQFMSIPQARSADFKKATERFYRRGNEASRIRVQVLQ